MSTHRGNTKMCGVLFVSIVGYSQQSNLEQIALKEQFVSFWKRAISEVPASDVLVVDTGDGAAMTALVEPEDSLRVALRLGELVESEPYAPMPLHMGINFGPIQLSTDVHDNPCAVGDALNVAQRVMSIASPGQITVSRAYYDVILPLSHKYAKMFFHLGKRADSQARYHDVYGWGSASPAAPHATQEQVKPQEIAATERPKAAKVNTEWSPPKRSLLSRMLGKVFGLIETLFALIKFAILLIVIYELFVLIPILKEPEHVRKELSSQINQVKSIWSGLIAAEETIHPPAKESKKQKPPKQPSHATPKHTEPADQPIVPADEP
ncbi:hypothetical protein OYT1_ch1845 [Ferriphaselus amnicola]|uniref:Guanylate cyclase domain-containing protein n=1 Tax=Ferriphaselus amnicola TaxID=1188319 RepID=A0A2Z6GCL9_9PROT|nr:adenylate/guanylate cyclase domain-containing protein [Ferriphaselus amnicola]BBE51373.1 hypothetical protein OYT1_ch1845 [Ferriphaselus amnicola]